MFKRLRDLVPERRWLYSRLGTTERRMGALEVQGPQGRGRPPGGPRGTVPRCVWTASSAKGEERQRIPDHPLSIWIPQLI